MNKVYAFGLIGCGGIARIHAKAIAGMPSARLGGVYDPIPANASAFAGQYGCKVYAALEELLVDSEIDVVNICTPSGTHAAIAAAAANAGKHVVVEKPLAINLPDALAVVRAQKENNVKICVISQLRFSPAVQAARGAVQGGLLGRLVLCSLSMRYNRSADYYKSGGWRGKWATDGGGALMNQGIHGLDLLCYLCGPVVSVRASCKTLLHDIEVEDTLCAVLEFANGAIGTIEASTAVKPGHSRRIEIGGSEGSITLTEDAVTEWQVSTPMPEYGPSGKADTANDPAALEADGHRMQLENLLAAVEGTGELLVDAAAGCKTVETILGIYRSAESGQIVRFEMSE